MQKDRQLTPWLDTDLAPLEGEEWRDVVGYDGLYHVSNYGRVKSLRRLNSVGKTIRERILRYSVHPKTKECAVVLYADTVAQRLRVMVLVAEAFSIRKAANEVYIHQNKNQSDNRAGNIVAGSRGESNALDRKVGGWRTSAVVGTGSKKKTAHHLATFGVFSNGELVAKRCKTCRVAYPLTQYHRVGGVLVHTCKTCAAKKAGVRAIDKGTYDKALAQAGVRKCARCDAVKPLEAFGKDSRATLGRKRTCDACRATSAPARRLGGRLTADAPS